MIDKRVIERVRMISLPVALIGGLFKLMHWPGANILLIVGIGNLILYHTLRGFIADTTNKREVYVGYSRNFSIAILLAGVLFRLMHWSGSNNMLIAGIAGFVFSLAFQQFYTDNNGSTGNQ